MLAVPSLSLTENDTVFFSSTASLPTGLIFRVASDSGDAVAWLDASPAPTEFIA